MSPHDSSSSVSRRHVLQGAAGLVAVGAASMSGPIQSATAAESKPRGLTVKNNRINQSICHWPFANFGEKWSLDQTCQAAVQLGCKSVELLGPDSFATLKKHGLVCAMTNNGMPGAPFVKGLNNPKYQAQVIETTKKHIDACAEAGMPNVIAFTGFKWVDVDDPSKGEIDPDEGAKNTVKGLKELTAYAEKKNVTICMEHLNSRVLNDNNRGHPGFQGDHIDYCADIIRAVGSPNCKLLFDIYHVQIMDGDVITRILDYGTDLIGHIHTAGNPGRCELDNEQEIAYAPIMRALLKIGYKGYVGQEFIPTRDPMAGLRAAVAECDV
ncbi:TIM barrel protein [Planctomycetales bacterium ZRK34]|nr:TIM barrel protein [Planctomycetales bacterium ZRK34]